MLSSCPDTREPGWAGRLSLFFLQDSSLTCPVGPCSAVDTTEAPNKEGVERNRLCSRRQLLQPVGLYSTCARNQSVVCQAWSQAHCQGPWHCSICRSLSASQRRAAGHSPQKVTAFHSSLCLMNTHRSQPGGNLWESVTHGRVKPAYR